MEDVIYILIGLAWFGYSAYKANQKKVQKNATRQAEAQSFANQHSDEDETDASFETSELIERLFSGEPSPKRPVPFSEPSGLFGDLNSPPPMADEKIPESMLHQLRPEYESIEYVNPRPAGIEVSAKEPVVKEQVPHTEEIISFNLRQAVIHQAILNRPYS